MPLLRQIRKDRRKAESCELLKFGSNVTSQSGEDGILREIFARIGVNSRWCVEFGAWDGKKFSNTFDLVQNRDWSGVLIEGSPAKFKELEETYRGNPRAVCLCGIVEAMPGKGSLDDHLSGTPIPQEFDLLSIDIDGNDYHVWASMTKFRPRVVIIEFNPAIPNDIIFVQDADFSVNQGCSLLALVELAKSKGYELAAVTPLNGIFVVAEDFSKLGIVDNEIDAMAYSACDGKYFDGYDGTLFHVGFEKLHWIKGAPLKHEALQVLPPEKRRWSDGIANS